MFKESFSVLSKRKRNISLEHNDQETKNTLIGQTTILLSHNVKLLINMELQHLVQHTIKEHKYCRQVLQRNLKIWIQKTKH